VEQLDDKTAVVTGAASGIGRALAARLAAEGMHVIAADVEAGALAGAASDTFVVDVSDAGQVEALAAYAFDTYGSVDVLCNNAGVFTGGLMWQRSVADFEWTLGVNLWGILHAIRAFVPRMVAAGTPAHIVNTSSMAGLCTNAFSGPYTVSKFAALAATECLAHDLAAVGAPIKVSALVPGAVATQIASSGRNRPAQLPPAGGEDAAFVEQTLADFTRDQGAPPDEVAALVVDALHNDTFLIPTRASYADQIRTRADALVDSRLPPGAAFY
jgi:NAD(P)-dependent dehydrogenase (short-subunit alcohol dehydrogenase family)